MRSIGRGIGRIKNKIKEDLKNILIIKTKRHFSIKKILHYFLYLTILFIFFSEAKASWTK